MWRRRIERTLIISLGLLVVSGAVLLGGVHPENQVRLSFAALALFGVCVLWRTLKKGELSLGAPFWVLAGLAGICLVQLWDLAPGLQAWLQPRGAALMTYTTGGLGEPVRRCVSLDPPGTALELAKALGLVALAGATTLLVRDGPRALLLLWTINVGAMALALLAAVQYVMGAPAVYWVYTPEAGRGFVAPFVNPNHAGAFYGALTFLNLGLALHIRERRAQVMGVALSALPALLVIASASRGAIVATAVGALLFVLLLWRAGVLTTQRFGYAVALAVIVGTVALPSSALVRKEFTSGTKWEAVDEEAKVEVWRDALRVARAHPLTGFGRGAFRSAFPAFQQRTAGMSRTFTHPENLFIQWLTEVGPVVFGMLLLGILVLAVGYFRRVSLRPLHAIALCPLFVLVGQNTVDFNLEFPGTGYLAVACLGVLAGLRLGRTRRLRGRLPRLLTAAALCAGVVLGLVTVSTWGRWGAAHDLRTEGRRIAGQLERGEDPARVLAAARQAIGRHPSDYYLQYLAGSAALRLRGALPLRHFNRALYLNPRSTLTQYQVGRALHQHGHYDQALNHYLAALRLRMPLAGKFGRDLFRLLQRLWLAGSVERRLALGAGCEPGVGAPGAQPAVDCLITAMFFEQRRGAPMGRVARIDVAAGFQLAQWLERVKLYPQARVAYEQLRDADPRRGEYLEALARVTEKAGEAARALYWARHWVRTIQSAPAYAHLVAMLHKAGQRRDADQMADAGLSRFPEDVPLVALKAELLLTRKQVAAARQLLLARTLGQRLQIKDEIRLLELRIKLEKGAGNKRRVARLQSRLGELQNMVKAGYQGLSPRSRL